MRYLLSILLMICFSFTLLAQEKQENSLRIYPYKVSPMDYPINKRRPSPPATRDLFQNKMQFQQKSFSNKHFKPNGDISGGTALRIEEKVVANGLLPKHKELAKWIKDSDHTLKLAGYKIFRTPKVAYQNYNERAHVEGSYSDVATELYNLAGPKFLGLQFGESDASYLNLSPSHISPMSRDHMLQYMDYQRYFEYYGNNVGNRVVLHVNEGTSHYLMKEGIATIGEAQTFYRGKVNPLVHYVFLRGASKQYGILLGMGFSGTTPHGNMGFLSEENKNWAKHEIIKEYGELIPDPKSYPTTAKAYKALRMYFQSSSDRGSSLSLFRRLIYSNYMYNGVVMNYEFGAYYDKNRVADKNGKPVAKKEKKLSPAGQLVKSVGEFVDKHPDPGAHITPIAFYMDFYNGWRTPNTKRKEFTSWTNLPYSKGDYFTDNLFSQFYPGYQNVGKYENVSFGMTETPYGDAVDAIFSDAEQEILNRYQLMIVGGDLLYDFNYQRHKLEKFAESGGTVIVTGQNAKKLWPEWSIASVPVSMTDNSKVNLDSKAIQEPLAFDYLPIKNLPSNAHILAKNASDVLAFEMRMGEGNIIISLTENGINKNPQEFSWDDDPTLMYPEGIKRPYYMVKHLESIIDKKAKACMPFEAGENLGLITNRKEKGLYTLALFNNEMKEKDFEIKSNIGDIKSIKEIQLNDTYIKDVVGYYPRGFEQYPIGKNTKTTISGYDVRIFEVKIKESNSLHVLAQNDPVELGKNRFLNISTTTQLKEKILSYSSFFTYFDGVNIKANAMAKANPESLKRESLWMNRKHLRFIIDGRGALENEILEAIQNASVFDYAKDVVIDKKDKNIEMLANDYNITVHYAKDQSIQFIDELKNKPVAQLQVLNRYYDQWDDVFHDYSIVWMSNPYQYKELKGNKTLKINPINPVKQENKMHWIALRNMNSLSNDIASIENFADHFGGVLINGKYVFESAEKQCVADREFLIDHNIDAIVDLRSLIDGYRQIVFEIEWGKIYDKGMVMSEIIMQNMQKMGIKKMLIPSDKFFKRGMTGYKEFCSLAKKYELTIVLEHNAMKDVKELLKATRKMEGWGMNNFEIAGSYQADLERKYKKAKLEPNMWLLMYQTKDRKSSLNHPLCQAPKDYLDLEKLPKDKTTPMVLDAEYLTNKELRKDLQLLNW
ncbi:hypothetical protein [Aureibacter tunicatorum]|uniref:Uncharacterized protein n=1 Tax=Aureibacter tunicatorum TaxID=866807 RepID=A0AAE4BVH6_9BACT|nr:hypothetical protein [Aureibacter tunicatorum]MDR6241738.1 hypothetical protein [Aureibacter tunicatorum]